MSKYEVITLCGSTRFKDEFLKAQYELTLAGKIVLSVGVFGHDSNLTEEEQKRIESNKEMLDDMHKEKIRMADAIYVIAPEGYIGSSTRSEIEFARQLGKKIYYWGSSI